MLHMLVVASRRHFPPAQQHDTYAPDVMLVAPIKLLDELTRAGSSAQSTTEYSSGLR
jgi:hypothetical protein